MSGIREGKYAPVMINIIESDERLDVIKEIREYAKGKRNFDTGYLDHVESCLSRRGYVTAEHYNKLLNIYYSYFIDKNIQD